MRNILKKALFFLFLCLVLTTFSGLAQTIRYTLLENTSDGALVRVDFPTYKTAVVEVNGVEMRKLVMPQAYPMLEVGAPELLQTAFSLIVPDNCTPTAEVVASDFTTVTGFELAPSKGKLYRTVNPAEVSYVKGSSYFEDRFQKDNIVTVGEPYRLRDYSGVALHLYPFAYNPVRKQLKVFSSITVRVHYNARQALSHPAKMAKCFDDVYANHFLNYAAVKSTPLQEDGDMLILAPDNFCEAMQPYADWKRRNGYATEIVSLSTVGNSATAVKNYILNYYNSHNLAYVVLVGDNQQFPTITAGGNISDNYYGELVGNDKYPDVIIGKISAESIDQVAVQVEKFLQYERGPQEGAHFPIFLGISSDQGPGDNNEYDYDHIRNIDNILTQHTYTSGYEMLEGSQGGLDESGNPTAAMVTQALNSGVGIINYCGHGAETSWVTSNFKVSNINALTNYNKLPFIISVACVNGAYSGRTCFAEAWLRASKNGQPTGAVGALMSTINQPWNSPMCAQDRMIELLTGHNNVQKRSTYGGIVFNGIIKMLDTYNDYEVARTWILFGDPALLVRTDVPQTLQVNHSDKVRLGFTTVEFSSPVDARVTLCRAGEILATGNITGGTLSLQLPADINVSDTLEVLATAPNYIPYMGVMEVIPNEGPFLICQEMMVNDEGNHNGDADYGETVNLSVVMKNVGSQDASNAQVKISTTDPYLTVLNGEINVSSIARSASQTFDNAFRVKVAPNAPAFYNALITMRVIIGDDTTRLSYSLMLHAPLFKLDDIVVDDATTGNGNGKLDLGEIAFITVKVTNAGNGVSKAGIAHILNPDATLTLYRFPQEMPALDVNQDHIVRFKVKSKTSTPVSSLIRIKFNSEDGYSQTHEFTLKVGSLREDFETGDFSAYSWSVGGTNSWTVTTQNPYEGHYAARSANIGNNATSTLSIQRTHQVDDTLTFYYKVSSEAEYDFLSFYIDNQEIEKWSGEVDWTRFSMLVPAGTHTYRWRYKKDTYMAEGQDMAMIDAIDFPCMTTAVGIEEFAGETLMVSPNPTTGPVTLQLPEEMATEGVQCQIFDLTGRMLGSQPVMSVATNLSLEAYPAGVYILKITDNQSVLNTVKIIKQ